MSSELKARAWPNVTLGDVVERITDRRDDPESEGFERFVGVDDLDADELELRRCGLIDGGGLPPTFRYAFPAGAVLFPTRRPALRKCAIAPFSGITGEKILVLQSRDASRLAPAFLPYLLASEPVRKWVIDRAIGSVTPHFRWRDLAEFTFPLPPFDEQRRIAAALASMDAAADTLRRADHTLNAVVAATFGDLRARSGSALSLPVSELTTEPPRNGFSPPPNADGRGLRTVSISVIRDNAFNPAGCIKHAVVDPVAIRPFLVQADDVFVVRGNGNREMCGKAGLSEQSYEDLFYPDLLIRLRFDRSKLLPAFAVAQWNSFSVHRLLMTRAKSSNGIWKINGEDVRVHRLLVPPISEQVRLVERLADLQRQSSALAVRRRALSALKAEVLTRSFAT